MEAVSSEGFALCYATKELRSDRQIVLTAVKRNGVALWYVGKELRSDPQIMEIAMANAEEDFGKPPVGLKVLLLSGR